MSDQLISLDNVSDFFGPLYSYIQDDSITDVDFNGKEVWVTDIMNKRHLCKDLHLSETFVDQFCGRVANCVSKAFNRQAPILEAETDCLRITVVHESVSLMGRSICIRKTPPYVRLDARQMILDGYCSEEVLDLLAGLVLEHKNIVVVGEPGAGKTELCKFLSGFIPEEERVITIEDTPEWHFSSLHPGHDAVELRINKQMDYSLAIKTCLRLNPRWIMLSEARSKEVVHLIESFSTGVRGMTTLHASDVRKIPDRMLNMAGADRDMTRMENDIFSFIDVGILVRRGLRSGADGSAELMRYIDQICFFTREDGQNRVEMIVEDGKFIDREDRADMAREDSEDMVREDSELIEREDGEFIVKEDSEKFTEESMADLRWKDMAISSEEDAANLNQEEMEQSKRCIKDLFEEENTASRQKRKRGTYYAARAVMG